MNRPLRSVTRRGFLRGAALATLGLTVGNRLEGQQEEGSGVEAPSSPAARAKVVLARDPGVVNAQGSLDLTVFGRMLDQALCALEGVAQPEEAWKRFFGPRDRPGIKSNVYGYLRTPVEVEELLRKRVAACGLQEAGIPCTDREARTLLASCTALINVRPVRNHHWSGIGGCLKNHIMFVENPSSYHPDSCANLGAIWQLPILKDKTRLNILLALRPLFYGRGPHNFDPRHQWTYGGLFVSRDPVAIDALGAELLRLKRIEHFGEDRPVTPTKHIQVAETRYGLGVSDLKRIDLVKLGWKEGILFG
ncbi:MAG: DUF362 domain-containing protein [Acidobacteria bacterium]|nr:DUF362 domain-containing protein [Acidobacteriota bacterium]